MSAESLTAAIVGLTGRFEAMNTTLEKSIGSLSRMTEALDTTGAAAKQAVDPFAEFQKTIDSLPKGAESWARAFNVILEKLKEGKLNANEARDAIQQIIIRMEQLHDVDAFSGGSVFLQTILQQLEKMLALLQQAKR